MNPLKRINGEHHSFEIYKLTEQENSNVARRFDGVWFYLNIDFYTDNKVPDSLCVLFEKMRHDMQPEDFLFADEPTAPKCSKCAALCCKPWHISLTEEEKRKPLFKPFINVLGLIIKPCPFLTATNACSIYTDRPFGCRKYDCRVDKRNMNAPNEPRNAEDMKESI